MVQLLKESADHATVLDTTPRPASKGSDLRTLHRAAFLLAKERVAKDHSSQDRVLMEEVKAIDDLLRAANLMVERLREWHALHDAEVVRSAADAEALVKQVQAMDPSGDAAMTDADRRVLSGFADALGAVQSSWRAIEARVTDLMTDVAPNITSVVGPMVGARLITLAGGLPRIGVLPSSTIQTLGAETALFRHIKEGTNPPKHGIIFQHPLVFQAPLWQRGAVARVLANHVALAARADATTGNDLAAMLQKSLEADLGRVRAKKARPPPRDPRHGRRPPGKQGGRPGGAGGAGGPGGPRRGPPGKGGHKGKGGPRGPRGPGAPRGPGSGRPGGKGAGKGGPKGGDAK